MVTKILPVNRAQASTGEQIRQMLKLTPREKKSTSRRDMIGTELHMLLSPILPFSPNRLSFPCMLAYPTMLQ